MTNVLIIKKSERNSSKLINCLEGNEHINKVYFAQSSEEALKITRKHQIDLAFIDSGLHQNNDWATIQSMKEYDGNIYCVLLIPTLDDGEGLHGFDLKAEKFLGYIDDVFLYSWP